MAAPIDSYRKYSLVRIGHGLIVLALAYLTVFLLLFVLPGDPISARLNDPDSSYSPEQIDQLLAYYGMDQPLTVQLWRAVSRLFQGDLGYSLTTVEPVGERIIQALPSTIQLSVITLIFAVLIALVLTVVATVAPALPVRRLAASIPAGLLSVPTFVFGLLVLQVFSYKLGLFSTLKTDGWIGALPAAAVLALPISAPFARVLIENAREVQTEPFVTFAKSKGMSTARLLFAHIARPSSLPGVTMLGLAAAELITGSVIVEAIFNRHGIGSVIESAVSSQDSPVLLGIILLAAGVVVVVNLGVDLLYPLLDPRLQSAQTDGAPTEVAATVTPTSVEALR